MRLQVFLSHHTTLSRRKAMEVVQKGEVSVNGRIIKEPSFTVIPGKDKILFNDKLVTGHEYQYIVLHKPEGYTTTKSDRFALKTVYDLLPKEFQMLSPAGRLDKDTEGLLLLSNDGEFIYQLTHPKFNMTKKYVVEVGGKLEKNHQAKIQSGVEIEGKKTYPAEIRNVKVSNDKTQLEMIIHEGRKRQIRLMFAKFRYKVIYLKRLAQGPIRLGNLKKGSWRLLTKEEVNAIKKAAQTKTV